MGGIDLPDVNVWLALSSEGHVHHKRATEYWENESRWQVAFNTVTMLGLMRVLSLVPVTGLNPLTVAQSHQIYTEWASDHNVIHLDEPPKCRTLLERFVLAGNVTPRTWTDAYLASFAVSLGLRLATLDSDFSRFPGLDWIHLKP